MTLIHHSEETDAIILKYGGAAIAKATAELRQRFGHRGWYWRKVRDRAVALGLQVPLSNRQIELPLIPEPTAEIDAVFFKYPGEFSKCSELVGWPLKAVQQRMFDLEIVKPKTKNRRVYKPTKKIDGLIREYHGHVPTLRKILTGWTDATILDRAYELGVRTKGDRLPTDIKYLDPAAIDDVIQKYNGYVIPISNETGWGKEAIRRRARKIGVKVKTNEYTGKRYTYQKMYVPTPQVDEIIQTCWAMKHRGLAGGIVVDAVARIKALGGIRWSEGAVTKRAIELGLSKSTKITTNLFRWTEAENQLLENNAHQSLTTIQLKLHSAFPDRKRTQTAILSQIGRRRLRSKSNLDGYDLTTLSKLIGMGKKMIVRLTAMGELRGTKREMERTEEQGGGFWYYSREVVRNFILSNPEYIDLVKVDKLWFIDLLSKGKLTKLELKDAA